MESSVERTRTDDGTIIVTVRGEIDFANAEELADGVRNAVCDAAGVVRVDLRKATFIDSTGLGALIEGYRAAASSDVRFVVTNPTPSFRRVLIVTGLCDLFGLTEPAEEQAEPTQATGA